VEPTTILSNEHRVIEIMLSVLEKLADKALADKMIDRQPAEESIDFIRNFADRCHHGKEETHLFTAMVKKGIPQEGGPVGQMLYEHEQGRLFVRGMADNIEAGIEGDEKAVKDYVENALGYVELLRAHIHKEDRILFPMASRILDGADKTQLLEKFETVESEHMGQGTHDKYIHIAEKLADRFGVNRQEIAGFSCGCGHK
jgi:hemerythrin-like domain-containing protein